MRDTKRPVDTILIGDVRRIEFHRVVHDLLSHMVTVCVRSDLIAAQVIQSELETKQVILLQTNPGQFTQRQLDELLEAFPEAEFLLVAGPLCEGELRSGTPLSGIDRIYFHQWIKPPHTKEMSSPVHWESIRRRLSAVCG